MVVFGTHLVVLIHEGVQPQLLLVLLEKGFALIVRLGGATLGGAHHRGHLDPLGAVLLDGVAINLHFLVRPVVAVHAISLHIEPPQDSAVAAGAAAHHPRRDFCTNSTQNVSKRSQIWPRRVAMAINSMVIQLYLCLFGFGLPKGHFFNVLDG